ncbi:MAG: NAD-dependent succinate-semialdehyde dehydrogenase [Candidatus Palauibacterales bacterium]|nr:NAD-dependent succinate-semialdehyde dehydrogenase [Candidatus Palauibacterales bacterium]MDP2482987.1 NAD-dependent succinate-semialdehyde dehydrogenase [Candidatus Palauibacterales bacterium]
MSMKSVNPASGQVLNEYPTLSEPELESRLVLAFESQPAFARLPVERRAAWLARAADRLHERRLELGRLMTSEMGKTFGASLAEVDKCEWVCRYYAENGAAFLADERVESAARESRVRFQSLGVILAIMPWNFPFWQVFRFAAPALVAGNAGLLKHASNVPGCALAIESVFREAGFPDGAFQSLLIAAPRAETLVGDERIAAVTLTGSEPAGRAVARAAGQHLKKSVLELGGSDPFVVLEDADLERAAQTAVKARIINNGQSCIAAKRFIVARAVADEFESLLLRHMRDLTVGDPMRPDTDLGPLATPAIRAELHEQVERSVAAGARLLTGGSLPDGPGFYYPPTLLVDVPLDSPAAVEETFGPVAPVFRASDTREALALANSTEFGLGAAVWTRNRASADRFIDELQAGSVFVNGMVASDPRLPFGGIKRSGYGRELAIYGLREFLNVKTVWIGE